MLVSRHDPDQELPREEQSEAGSDRSRPEGLGCDLLTGATGFGWDRRILRGG